MNTDNEVANIRREERRKVFWAMNSLPWILLTLVLLSIVLYPKLSKLQIIAIPTVPIVPIVTNVLNTGIASVVVITNTVIPRGYEKVEHIDREYPFTVADMQLAKDINLDIEEELTKGMIDVVEANFVGKLDKDSKDMKKKIESDLRLMSKNLFDGFETWNKSKRR